MPEYAKNTTVSNELIKILCEGSCEGEESFGNCPYRRNGGCRVIQNLDMCQVNQLANAVIAAGWIRLPCKVGDTVYYAGIDTPVKFTVIGFSKGRMYDCSVADYEEFVEDNELNVDEWYVHLDSFYGLRQISPLSSFGKRLFVGADAEKEAEKALAERS